MVISVENRKIFPPPCIIFMPPLMEFPLELDIGARGQKTRMMGLPDGQNNFKIVLGI